MSTLANKHVVVIGDESGQVTILKNSLIERGVIFHELKCENFNSDVLDQTNTDLIILNHLHEEGSCSRVLKILKDDNTRTPIPVLCLVDETGKDIENALSQGAADYITLTEDPDVTIQKVEAVLGDGSTISDKSDIDISPAKVEQVASGIKIYIIEDDPLLRNLLSIKFNASGYPCEFSADGKNVIPAIKQFKPDVVILDLMLPGRSGFDVLKEIKASPEISQIPVVVFSNQDSTTDRTKAKELGAQGFYVKAMTDLSELVALVQELDR